MTYFHVTSPLQAAQTFPAVQVESKLYIYVNLHLFTTNAACIHRAQNALYFSLVTTSDYFC